MSALYDLINLVGVNAQAIPVLVGIFVVGVVAASVFAFVTRNRKDQ